MGDVAPEKKERERKEEKETESPKRASASYLLKSPRWLRVFEFSDFATRFRFGENAKRGRYSE